MQIGCLLKGEQHQTENVKVKKRYDLTAFRMHQNE